MISVKKKQKKKRQAAGLEIWKQQHKNSGECDQNHTGSAAAMEPAGAGTAFRRSQQLHGLQYVNFLGDGDSKTFSSLKNAFPAVYPAVEIQKLECCGHVQKRMGRHLTNKVTALKTHIFQRNGKTVKGIGGKGGLTKKAILKIQGHYGAAECWQPWSDEARHLGDLAAPQERSQFMWGLVPVKIRRW